MPPIADMTVSVSLSEGRLPVFAALASELGLGGSGDVMVIGAGLLVRSPHRLAEAAEHGLWLETMAASRVWRHRTGGTASLQDAGLHSYFRALDIHFV